MLNDQTQAISFWLSLLCVWYELSNENVNEYPTMHYFGNSSEKLHWGNVVDMRYRRGDDEEFCSGVSLVLRVMQGYVKE